MVGGVQLDGFREILDSLLVAPSRKRCISFRLHVRNPVQHMEAVSRECYCWWRGTSTFSASAMQSTSKWWLIKII